MLSVILQCVNDHHQPMTELSSDDFYLVYPFLQEVQQQLHCLHVLVTILLLASLDRHTDEHIQAGHGHVTQQVDGVAEGARNVIVVRTLFRPIYIKTENGKC